MLTSCFAGEKKRKEKQESLDSSIRIIDQKDLFCEKKIQSKDSLLAHMYVCRVKLTQRRLLEGFSCLVTGFNSESDYKGRLTTTHPCYLQVANNPKRQTNIASAWIISQIKGKKKNAFSKDKKPSKWHLPYLSYSNHRFRTK